MYSLSFANGTGTLFKKMPFFHKRPGNFLLPLIYRPGLINELDTRLEIDYQISDILRFSDHMTNFYFKSY